MSGEASSGLPAQPRRSRLSACVLAAADAAHLERCLKSLHFADEICVLLDARHGDACRAVAEAHAHRVEARPFAGYLPQRARSLELASHEWVLALDADEVVSPELATSIERAIGTAVADGHGFELDRVAWHLGRWIEHGDFHPDWKLRLARRAHARVAGREPHDRIEVDGAVARLAGRLEHYTYRDLDDQVERMRLFAGAAARALREEGRHASWVDVALRPPARFASGYVLKRGFLDGWPGFVIAVMNAYGVFVKYASLRELDRAGASR